MEASQAPSSLSSALLCMMYRPQLVSLLVLCLLLASTFALEAQIPRHESRSNQALARSPIHASSQSCLGKGCIAESTGNAVSEKPYVLDDCSLWRGLQEWAEPLFSFFFSFPRVSLSFLLLPFACLRSCIDRHVLHLFSLFTGLDCNLQALPTPILPSQCERSIPRDNLPSPIAPPQL